MDQQENQVPVTSSKTERHSMRMYPQDFEALAYWSKQYGVDRTEFLVTAMHHYIKWKNQDFDIPTAEIQRLNQMTDAVNSLISSQDALQKTVVQGFDTILGMSHGPSYLNEDETGDL